ncbi:hypothetical protein HDU97_005967 [Phlyctochytrium planicorne]|nr:hypothetical protein HDU97_005967 [Phlyctochytrium planicorne]
MSGPTSSGNNGDPIKTTNWLFTAEELNRTPSILEGMTKAEEIADRSKGCQYIMNVGMGLKLPQHVMSTACVYFHRFYMRQSFKNHNLYVSFTLYESLDNVGGSCVYLATKIEEYGRKLGQVVCVCAQKAGKNDNLKLDDTTREFWRWRDTILYYEEIILANLCFDLSVDHPYEKILLYSKRFGVSKELREHAWTFANEGTKLTLCLRYTSEQIALACMYFASVFLGEYLTNADEDMKFLAKWNLDISMMEAFSSYCN